MSLTCDGPTSDIAMFRELGVNLDPLNLSTSFPHPLIANEKVYIKLVVFIQRYIFINMWMGYPTLRQTIDLLTQGYKIFCLQKTIIYKYKKSQFDTEQCWGFFAVFQHIDQDLDIATNLLYIHFLNFAVYIDFEDTQNI